MVVKHHNLPAQERIFKYRQHKGIVSNGNDNYFLNSWQSLKHVRWHLNKNYHNDYMMNYNDYYNMNDNKSTGAFEEIPGQIAQPYNYLYPLEISLGADDSGGNVTLRHIIIQVNSICHAARQKQVIKLCWLGVKDAAEDAPPHVGPGGLGC